MPTIRTNVMTMGTPWHLWLVGVIAILFNAIGAFDFVMSMAQGSSYMASVGMTPAQIAHYQEMPAALIDRTARPYLIATPARIDQ